MRVYSIHVTYIALLNGPR